MDYSDVTCFYLGVIAPKIVFIFGAGAVAPLYRFGPRGHATECEVLGLEFRGSLATGADPRYLFSAPVPNLYIAAF